MLSGFLSLPKMRSYQSIFVLNLKRRLKKSMHKLQQLLVVINEPTSINVVEIQVEETLLFAALEKLLQLGRLLGEDRREVDCLHRVDRNLLAVPFDLSGYFGYGSHVVCWCDLVLYGGSGVSDLVETAVVDCVLLHILFKLYTSI